MTNTLIIAEAGVNHNGDMDIAKKLIDVAAGAGADYVKFQTFIAGKLVSAHAKKADYQIQNMRYEKEGTQLAMLRKLELKYDQHHLLIDHCKTRGIKFLSSPFDEDSMEFLVSLNVDLIKIPSGEITNLPYLEHAAKMKKPIVFSSGMATMSEIESAMAVFIAGGVAKKDVTVLHCNTEYPTPYRDVNLNAIKSIKDKTGIKVGYSDHTPGIEVAVAAVALGAVVIEKHFTLDRNMEGPDHKASLEPSELRQMIMSIRNIEKALGDGIKKPSASELKNKEVARKSIVAKVVIKKGEKFSTGNIVVKRPGNGISPMKWYEVLGKQAGRNYKADELIE